VTREQVNATWPQTYVGGPSRRVPRARRPRLLRVMATLKAIGTALRRSGPSNNGGQRDREKSTTRDSTPSKGEDEDPYSLSRLCLCDWWLAKKGFKSCGDSWRGSFGARPEFHPTAPFRSTVSGRTAAAGPVRKPLGSKKPARGRAHAVLTLDEEGSTVGARSVFLG